MQTSQIVVGVNSPNAKIYQPQYSATAPYGPTGVTLSDPTPAPEGINVPIGATSVTMNNRGTTTAQYDFDGGSQTAINANSSATVVITTQKILFLQGLNLLVDVIFTVNNQ